VDKCHRGVPSWICDADGLLSHKGANVVEGVIKLIAAGESPYVQRKCGSAGLQGYEVAVAVMSQMDTLGREAVKDLVAKEFAEKLHAKWGVGRAECQNGVLILLAVEDRQMYISTGAGTMKYLTHGVLGQIIDQSKPLLRQARYDEAMQYAVVNTGLALAGKSLAPDGNKEHQGWVLLVFLSVFAGFGFWAFRQSRRESNRYKACNTVLARIKRDQAALQSGSYTVTSCPICLEDFQMPPPAEEAPAPDPAEPSAPPAGRSGEDSEREPLIHRSRSGSKACGDASTGTTSSGDDLEKVKKPGSGGCSGSAGGEASPAAGAQAAAAAASTAGEGGQRAEGETNARMPLALPCGHLFCEPCLSRWLEQRKTSCPICRADVGGPDNAPSQPPPPPPPCQAQWEGEDFPEAVYFDDPRMRMRPRYAGSSWRIHYPFVRPSWGYHHHGISQAQQRELYRQDLIFRLQALRRRYPEYVTPQMVNTWGSDIASGRQLSATVLRDFQLRDPAVRAQLEGHGASGSRSGFGGGGFSGSVGGSSGGGRGGSW